MRRNGDAALAECTNWLNVPPRVTCWIAYRAVRFFAQPRLVSKSRVSIRSISGGLCLPSEFCGASENRNAAKPQGVKKGSGYRRRWLTEALRHRWAMGPRGSPIREALRNVAGLAVSTRACPPLPPGRGRAVAVTRPPRGCHGAAFGAEENACHAIPTGPANRPDPFAL